MRNFSKFKIDMKAETTKEGADTLAFMLGLSAIITSLGIFAGIILMAVT